MAHFTSTTCLDIIEHWDRCSVHQVQLQQHLHEAQPLVTGMGAAGTMVLRQWYQQLVAETLPVLNSSLL